MYTGITSRAVIETIMGDARTFRALLEFPSYDISGADVGAITLEHTMSDDGTITIGEVVSRRAEIKLYTQKPIRKGDTFRLWLYLLDHGGESAAPTTYGQLRQWTYRELSMIQNARIATLGRTKDPDGTVLDGELIPMGEFVVRKVTITRELTEIVAYDRLSASDVVYTPTITFPASSGTVTADVLQQLGITERVIASGGQLHDSDWKQVYDADGKAFCVSEEYSFTISDAPPEGTTCRELLGWIAAVYGGNAILDRSGAFTTVFLARGGDNFDMERLDEAELSAEDVRLSGVRCIASSDEELTAGSTDGTHVVEITCPYMTQSRLKVLWGTMRNIVWRPAQVSERLADPRRDMGDVRKYRRDGVDCSIPITSLIYHFDGGLSADITASGETAEGE